MIFHHVGCVVSSIADYLRSCIDPLGLTEVSPVYEVSSQQVRVCFVQLSSGVFLELVEPTGSASPVKPLHERGGGYYHLCFIVDDLDATSAELATKGFMPKEAFVSAGFGGRRCRFLWNPDGHLVELAESRPA